MGLGPNIPLPDDLAGGASVQYQDGFLIVGGYSLSNSKFFDTIYYYNPIYPRWEKLAETLSIGRTVAAAILVPDSFASCS